MQHPAPDDLLRAALGAERTHPPDHAALAEHFPDLEILACIGQGGMGAVYRVRRRADGKLLALKVMRPVAGKEQAFTARFACEAEALERLHHPNIVAIHGHGQGGPWCWLLMDLVEGANLREIATTGRLSPAQTLALVPPLCAALQYAHDHGVVHRDLKPENILLDAAGVPHLVDFGLAKLRDSAAGSGLTNTGASLGTLHYMAPEQVASAKDVDHRADIYALGVVIYELLTGQLPLGRFEAPSQRVQVDVRIDEVVLKALERDPERRWQQMRMVGQAVAAADGDSRPGPWYKNYRAVMITIAVLSTSAIFQLLVAWGSVLLSFITGTVIVGMLIYWVFVIVNHSIARVAAKDADLSRRVLVWVSFLLSLSGSCLFLAAAFTAFLATKSVEQCRDLNVPTPGITSFLSEFWNYQGWVMIVALVVGMCLFEIRSARTTRKVIINGVYVVASLIAATVVLVGLILPLPLLMGAS